MILSISVGMAVKAGIKAALTAPKVISTIINPENSSRKLLIAIFSVCAPLLLVVILLCGATSAVSGYVFHGDGMSDFWQSELYQEMQKANLKWENEKKLELINRAFEEDISDFKFDDKATLQEKLEYLENHNIKIMVSAPAIPYTLAYINHCEDIASKWGNIFRLIVDDEETISQRQIMNFYTSITSIEKTTYEEDEGIFVTYFMQVLSPEQVAQMYWPENTETAQMYVASYEQYNHFLGLNYAVTLPSTEGNVQMNMPHYFQADYQNVPYGRGTIATSGCAPTSIAMCISYLRNQIITPVDVVKFTGNQYYNWGQGGGSYWSIFPACAAHWNCKTVETRDINLVLQALQTGCPVIASMAPGHFTKNGHFIVLSGIASEGNLYVNDPSKSNYKKYGNQVPAEWVWTEAKGYFIFN